MNLFSWIWSRFCLDILVQKIGFVWIWWIHQSTLEIIRFLYSRHECLWFAVLNLVYSVTQFWISLCFRALVGDNVSLLFNNAGIFDPWWVETFWTSFKNHYAEFLGGQRALVDLVFRHKEIRDLTFVSSQNITFDASQFTPLPWCIFWYCISFSTLPRWACFKIIYNFLT